jgi:CubicO group peptidase (beta-lactamase class C family)
MSRPVRRLRHSLIAHLLLAVPIVVASAQAASLPAGMRARIDSIAMREMQARGAPSVSIAIVKDGQIAYTNAYGMARLDPPLPASPSMRYSIGSVSKQITATAVLLLAEQGRLSLDDKVGKFIPGLTRGDEVTIRQILSMTSGYQDYWPQDYVMPPMLKPVTAQAIVDQWAKKPLDFAPGSKWQYSNTNYVIAGLIVEKVSGMPLVDFLRQHVFTPLHMNSVMITDEGALGPSDPERYERFGLGPPRVAPKEGRGWMFAAGELAMSSSDLARWDIGVIDQSILKPASYRAQQTSLLLTDGRATGYGLGVYVGSFSGHRMISHGGEVSGFSTQNEIFPDDRMAIVVYANLFATDVQAVIANRIADLLFSTTDAATERAIAQTKSIFTGLMRGELDRTLFTSNANAYFSDRAIQDFASSIGSCATIEDARQTSYSLRGGMTYRGYVVRCGGKSYGVSTFVMPDGKIEQYIVTPE